MIVCRRSVTLLSFLALVAGCGVEGEDADLGVVTPAVQSSNSLLPDDLVGCRADAVAMLTTQRFAQSPTTSRMVSSAGCLKVLQYLFHCAASPGQTVQIKDQSGVFVKFPSADPLVAPQTPPLSLAPGWTTAVLGAAQGESVASCVGAHLNNLGRRVPIALSGPDLPPLGGDKATFPFVEGGIMADIELQPVKGCVSGALRALCPVTAEKTLKETRCVLTGRCDNFEVIGDCDKVCSKRDGEYYNGCSDGPALFTHVETVRLLAPPRCAAP